MEGYREKTNNRNLFKLQQPLNLTFAAENGTDAGVLKAEFFIKMFEIARRELFEHPGQMS